MNTLDKPAPTGAATVRRRPPGGNGDADVPIVGTVMDWDDDSPLPPRRPKLFSTVSWILTGVLVALGCFTLGARVGRNSAPAAAASTGRAAAGSTGTRLAGAGQGRTGGGGGFGAGGAAAGTFGQVQLVDGNNIYIQDNQGNVIKVTPAATATITANKPGTVGDFKPGDNVVVQGSADADGNIAAATSIAAAAGAFGRGAAAAQAAAPTPTTSQAATAQP